ncbi:IclR family transcriptional regulator [Halopelagius longus]|uniref:IclR family transcriptional regulator n=1 Tax=Halopelagius longus TaxID=1236180 RepID=A0A1H1FRY0_9EURY|nr:IclR family transcriptional regulator [Halopelagius longus]RDI70192.1 IclR family transcriptional regulator [Halopelagius longus]SDR03625.1 transcriptional regulator, IclR family [Halopelagius longus]
MTERTSDERGTTIKSVETALDVIEVLEKREQAGVTELADALGRSKSTIYHYVNTLEQRNYLEKEGGKYRLSLRFLALGGFVREREALYRHGKDDVDRLADTTSELVRLIVEDDHQGLTVYQAAGDNVTDPHTHVGTTDSLYCTAAGKAFLAELPEQQREAYFEETALEPRTEHTITDLDELRAEIADVEETGVALDDQECYEGIRCVATPVCCNHELLGAISVSGPVDRISDDRFRTKLPNELWNVAGVVEINTTYSRWESSID